MNREVPASEPGDQREVVLSVLCAVHNGADLLGQQLDSVAAQEIDLDWEVIIVDDHSTDGSVEVARSYADRLPRLQVRVSPCIRSQAAALNHAATVARGRYLVLVDADDELAPGYLGAMVRALDRHDAVGASADEVALNPPFAQYRTPMQVTGLPVVNQYLPIIIGATMGIRADALRAVGGWDPSVPTLLDVDISWRLQHAGFELALAPDAVLRYRGRTTLRGVVRQKRTYARADVLLAKRYRAHGAPRRGVRLMLDGWINLARVVVRIRDKRGAMLAADLLGGVLGRLEGSIRYRYLYL